MSFSFYVRFSKKDGALIVTRKRSRELVPGFGRLLLLFFSWGGVADYYYFFFFSGVGGGLMIMIIIIIPFLAFSCIEPSGNLT